MTRRVRRSALVMVVAMAFLPASASAEVIVGHSGWFWGDPLPQGQNLHAVDFSGARGYAVGDFGTALRTDNGGVTWRGLRTGTTTQLNQVQVVDANTVIIGGGCTLRRSTDGGASFSRLPFTSSERSCPQDVVAFDFPTPTLGFMVLTDGTVIRTTDAGRTFSQRTPLPGTRASGAGPGTFVEDLAFTGPNTGVAVLTGARLYRTTDAGNNWAGLPGIFRELRAIDFSSATNGLAVGDFGSVFLTQDGGASFEHRHFGGTGLGQNLVSVDCATRNICLMTISGGDRLARTEDGGSSSTTLSPSALPLSDVAFTAAPRAAAVGQKGTTVISDDAGVSFAQIGGQIPGAFAGLRSVVGQRAYSPGRNGRVARTLDGGKTWAAIGVSTSAGIRDVSFPLAATGFALDNSGTLLRTDNAGESWQILNTGSSSNPLALTAFDVRSVILAGPRGVRRSTNGGQSFAAVRSRAVRSASLRNIDRAGSTVFVFGANALAVSTNRGRSWRSVRRPRGKIEWVDFVTSRRGFLSTTSGRLYTTANRGRRWRELLTGTNRMGQLAFADGRRGWIAGAAPDVIRTTDGGRSWQPQNVTDGAISGIAALSGRTAVAQDSGSNRFYATGTGGAIGTPSRLSIRPSARRLRRTGRIRLSGRLRPARGGEIVSVLRRVGTRWSRRNVRVASNGTFGLTYRVTRSSYFLAQWSGDDRSAGDGSTAVKVTVRRPARRRR